MKIYEIDTNIGPGTTMYGIHYSNKPREFLSGSYFGTGIKGQEMHRLTDKYEGATPEIKKRIYFYAISPHENISSMHEQGLGNEVHKAVLHNILDFEAASQDEVDSVNAEAKTLTNEKGINKSNALEISILDHGYHGYASRGMIVVLGQDTVPVKYLGNRAQLK